MSLLVNADEVGGMRASMPAISPQKPTMGNEGDLTEPGVYASAKRSMIASKGRTRRMMSRIIVAKGQVTQLLYG